MCCAEDVEERRFIMRLRGLHLGGEDDDVAAEALTELEDALGRATELALHLPVPADAGAEAMLEDTVGWAAGVEAEVGAEAWEVAALELAWVDEDSADEEEDPEVPVAPEAKATGGAGRVNEWKLSSQISGNLVLS